MVRGSTLPWCIFLPSLLEKLASNQIWRPHAHPHQMDMSLEVVITG